MGLTNRREWIAVGCAAAFAAGSAMAAPIVGIRNGSFEETGTLIWNGWGTGDLGFYEAAPWIELGTIGAVGSMYTGLETVFASHGARVLRLPTDANKGLAAQYLGTMADGETYTFRADVIASTIYGAYAATAKFVDEGVANPSTVYATQMVSLAQGETGTFNLSYTATGDDDGKDLYIWLQSEGFRGGIDNAQLANMLPWAPTNPSPSHGAVDVSPTSILTWASSVGAIGYRVSLWIDGGPTNSATVAITRWNPGVLLGLTNYNWHVAASNGSGSTTGALWTFTTRGLPDPPVWPTPLDRSGITNVSPVLTWSNSALATGYQVFLWPVGGTTNTIKVSTNTWVPGALQAGTTYRWQAVATNVHGAVPGDVWTFTTKLIPYTYVYEADSVSPYGNPGELAAPRALNDDLVGTTWDDTTVLYYNPAQSTNKPHVTLFLSSYDSLGRLIVWYTRAIEAGIGCPASLTLSDDFGHTATTVFPPPPGNGTFGQDVALTGMEGTNLHLSLEGTTHHVGLSEIQVVGPAPAPPAVPDGPNPTDGNVNVAVPTSLDWNDSLRADGYSVYFWVPPEPVPLTPTTNVTASVWTPTLNGLSEMTYQWQVVATNVYGSATGAVWTFTTGLYPFTYKYDNVSARPENYIPGQPETTTNPHVLTNGVTGGWGALYLGQDYLGNNPASFWPAITITLTRKPRCSVFDYLTIWHYGEHHEAGVYGPASLTVGDDFGNTTAFDAFQDIETSTNVPISGMQGTNLHLRFTPPPSAIHVGISEIKVRCKSAGMLILIR